MLLNMVIRPPRATYQDDTGSEKTLKIAGKDCIRKAFKLKNKAGQNICCTYIQPKED